MDNTIDKCIILLALSLYFTLCGILAIPIYEMQVTEPSTEYIELPKETEPILPEINKVTSEQTPYFESDNTQDNADKVSTVLFYATEPIGRYYITAYNHEETGGKRTASGTICHEGTITTCAADPRYHKFGEYLEIGGRIYRVEDTGSAVKKKHIDIYFYSYKEMARYGSHYENIYRVTFPFGKPADK